MMMIRVLSMTLMALLLAAPAFAVGQIEAIEAPRFEDEIQAPHVAPRIAEVNDEIQAPRVASEQDKILGV